MGRVWHLCLIWGQHDQVHDGPAICSNAGLSLRVPAVGFDTPGGTDQHSLARTDNLPAQPSGARLSDAVLHKGMSHYELLALVCCSPGCCLVDLMHAQVILVQTPDMAAGTGR